MYRFWKVIVSSNRGVKEIALVYLFSTLSKWIDSRPPSSNASGPFDAFEGHFLPPSFSSLSWRGSLQPFCGLFAVFCKKHGGRKFHLVHVTGFTVLLVVRGAPSPKNGSNWSFPFSRVIPDRKLVQLCAWKRNMGNGREEANERWSIDFIFYTKIIPFKKRKEKEINTIAKKTFRIGWSTGPTFLSVTTNG